jgi:hypothetical protein
MSAQDTVAGEAIMAPDIKVNKKIVPFEDGSPDEEPLFVNCLQVVHAGGVAYIDVGVIPLDEILSQPQTSATFLVLTRLVMSMDTLVGLRDQINQVLDRQG